MVTALAHLNDPEIPLQNHSELMALFTPMLVDQIHTKFGLNVNYDDFTFELAKVLMRYQSAAKNAEHPQPIIQTRELARLKGVVDRALTAFDAISPDNRADIDEEILYRDPFNRKFYFKEQLDYWSKNADSTQLAINKLGQISHALESLEDKHKRNGLDPKKTKNAPLDHLIQNLVIDFERDTERKASKCCYYVASKESYAGQFFDFVIFILDHFAPNSYHSHGALGKRITRTLAPSSF